MENYLYLIVHENIKGFDLRLRPNLGEFLTVLYLFLHEPVKTKLQHTAPMITSSLKIILIKAHTNDKKLFLKHIIFLFKTKCYKDQKRAKEFFDFLQAWK